MQSTPQVRHETWVMQFETIGMFRSHGMLWTRATDDPYHRWGDRFEMFGNTCEDMVGYARCSGNNSCIKH